MDVLFISPPPPASRPLYPHVSHTHTPPFWLDVFDDWSFLWKSYFLQNIRYFSISRHVWPLLSCYSVKLFLVIYKAMINGYIEVYGVRCSASQAPDHPCYLTPRSPLPPPSKFSWFPYRKYVMLLEFVFAVSVINNSICLLLVFFRTPAPSVEWWNNKCVCELF